MVWYSNDNHIEERKKCRDNGNRVHCVFNINYPHRLTLTHDIFKADRAHANQVFQCFFSLHDNFSLSSLNHKHTRGSYSDQFSDIIKHFPLFNRFNETVYIASIHIRCSNMKMPRTILYNGLTNLI